jgi:hypothetical protein
MGEPLEERLLVARQAHHGLEQARGVGMKAEHVADAAAVLEVEPAGALEARAQASRGGALDVFVGRLNVALGELGQKLGATLVPER